MTPVLAAVLPVSEPRARLRAMSTRKGAILDDMRRHRERFEAFCGSLTPNELTTPVPNTPWNVHGYIAHLATVESLISPFFARFVGITDIPLPDPPPPVPFDIDEWNE